MTARKALTISCWLMPSDWFEVCSFVATGGTAIPVGCSELVAIGAFDDLGSFFRADFMGAVFTVSCGTVSPEGNSDPLPSLLSRNLLLWGFWGFCLVKLDQRLQVLSKSPDLLQSLFSLRFLGFGRSLFLRLFLGLLCFQLPQYLDTVEEPPALAS